MANEDDVARLRQGVDVWNTWKYEEHPSDFVDLSGADLQGIDLRQAFLGLADLSEANLSGADLTGAYLELANLRQANLRGADLREASLGGADLRDADLRQADLRDSKLTHLANFAGADLGWADLRGMDLRDADIRQAAHLSGADLGWADLRRTDLHGIDLSRADLRRADLRGAIIYEANLRGANLSGTKLWGSDLTGANLTEADLTGTNLRRMDLTGVDLRGMDLREMDLTGANLTGANLTGADLRDADFRQATLIDTLLCGANLTGARLWETQRSGWSIKGVICQWAFWDRDGKERIEYGDGDFERIFAEKPRIVLRYPGGISPVELAMLPLIIERRQAEHPGCELHIRSVQDDGSGATVIITVDDLANRSEGFEGEVAALRSEITTLQHRLRNEDNLRLVAEAKYQGLSDFFRPMLELRQALHFHYGPTIGGNMSGDIYSTTAGQVAAIGREAHVQDNTFQQIWNQAGIDPQKLTEELGRLHSSMRREAAEGTGTPEQEAIDAVAAAEKAAARGDGPTTLRHLKAAGKWTLGFAEKIGVAIAAEAIKRAAMG